MRAELCAVAFAAFSRGPRDCIVVNVPRLDDEFIQDALKEVTGVERSESGAKSAAAAAASSSTEMRDFFANVGAGSGTASGPSDADVLGGPVAPPNTGAQSSIDALLGGSTTTAPPTAAGSASSHPIHVHIGRNVWKVIKTMLWWYGDELPLTLLIGNATTSRLVDPLAWLIVLCRHDDNGTHSARSDNYSTAHYSCIHRPC